MQFILIFLAITACASANQNQHLCCHDEAMMQIYNVARYNCACEKRTEGAMRYTSGKLFVCNGKKWMALKFEHQYGSEENPGRSCKDILKQSSDGLENGVYWMRLNGKGQAFPVYCAMQSGGWIMVFKGVTGVPRNVYQLWNSNGVSDESVLSALDVTNKHKNHYKNRIVDNWTAFNPTQARVVVYTGGQQNIALKFNAQKTNKLNWFSLNTLIESPWTDIRSQPKNFFAILGGCHPECRSFFINRSYGGCPNDAGWLVFTGRPCDWEKRHLGKPIHYTTLLYTKKATYTNWNRGQDVGIADTLVVYLQ